MHILITGASSGIGAALAREFHAAGAQLTLVARRATLLESLSAELGERTRIIVGDVTQLDWLDRVGGVDVFVNNAGLNASAPFAQSDPGASRHMLEVDFLAPLNLSRTVIPRMLARGSGVLVNVSSVAALVPPAGMSWYAAAKAGLGAFSECLASELHGSGVHVLTVYPGPIDNGTPQPTYDMYGSAARSLPVATAAALARQIRLAIEHRRRRLIYPRFYALARWFPWIARWLVDRGTPRLLPIPR